jgi:hypothetical protein
LLIASTLAPLAADRDHEVAGADQRIAIAKLRREIDLTRDAGQLLDQELADQRRVVRGAARDHDDSLDVGGVELDVVEVDVVVLEIDATDERLRDSARLLVDLLLHVVPEAALLGLDRAPQDRLGLAFARPTLEVGDLAAGAAERDDLALIDEDHLPRLLEDRGDVRGDEALVVAEADDQRRRILRRDQLVRRLVVHDDDRVRPLDLQQRPAHRLGQIAGAGELLRDQVGEDLGVGLRGELGARGLEPRPQLQVVLDDAVVDDADRPDLVGMRVDVRRPAVGGPPRMADAG